MTSSVVTQKATSASEQLVNLWLGGKSRHTVDYYRRSAKRLEEFVGKPIHLVTFAEVQAFAVHLESLELAASSRRSIISAVKSLLSFGNKIGVLTGNVAAPLKPPNAPDTLSERILSESQVQVMIALETDKRNHAMLRLLYYSGLRVSELCSLKWRNLQARGESGQITVFGKGGKTRSIVLPLSLWQELQALRGAALENEPIFCSRSLNNKTGGHLNRYSVDRIVKAAAARAGISGKVSPHWLRHAHASHALERGAKVHLVQATLGHSNVAITGRYLHARPEESSGLYLPG
ncbi:MAG TPA: tyrosine-type recombinase/integrase [Nostocaceae cyanobacterium]|nr:tyrosine-type recombinase/integrase [Kamptonema sp.]HLO86182.1 tyrosine-type recombinase/integrase [Nostocaceae cyanobacterium]